MRVLDIQLAPPISSPTRLPFPSTLLVHAGSGPLCIGTLFFLVLITTLYRFLFSDIGCLAGTFRPFVTPTQFKIPSLPRMGDLSIILEDFTGHPCLPSLIEADPVALFCRELAAFFRLESPHFFPLIFKRAWS